MWWLCFLTVLAFASTQCSGFDKEANYSEQELFAEENNKII